MPVTGFSIGMSETVTIRVPKRVKELLERVQRDFGLPTIGEAAEKLLSPEYNPLTLITMLLDMRNDFKKLVVILENLNKKLEVLLEKIERFEKILPGAP